VSVQAGADRLAGRSRALAAARRAASLAFEAWHELRKLPDLIQIRLASLNTKTRTIETAYPVF
jgi:hypothetical protein